MELEKPRNVIILITPNGSRLSAIWKRTKERWYIVEEQPQDDANKILRILTARQFQEAIENREYSIGY